MSLNFKPISPKNVNLKIPIVLLLLLKIVRLGYISFKVNISSFLQGICSSCCSTNLARQK